MKLELRTTLSIRFNADEASTFAQLVSKLVTPGVGLVREPLTEAERSLLEVLHDHIKPQEQPS